MTQSGSNGQRRTLPEIPRSWFILAALVGAGIALVLHVISQADFLAILGIVFGIHTIGSEQRARATQETAAQGTAAATVAAIQASAAADSAATAAAKETGE